MSAFNDKAKQQARGNFKGGSKKNSPAVEILEFIGGQKKDIEITYKDSDTGKTGKKTVTIYDPVPTGVRAKILTTGEEAVFSPEKDANWNLGNFVNLPLESDGKGGQQRKAGRAFALTDVGCIVQLDDAKKQADGSYTFHYGSTLSRDRDNEVVLAGVAVKVEAVRDAEGKMLAIKSDNAEANGKPIAKVTALLTSHGKSISSVDEFKSVVTDFMVNGAGGINLGGDNGIMLTAVGDDGQPARMFFRVGASKQADGTYKDNDPVARAAEVVEELASVAEAALAAGEKLDIVPQLSNMMMPQLAFDALQKVGKVTETNPNPKSLYDRFELGRTKKGVPYSGYVLANMTIVMGQKGALVKKMQPSAAIKPVPGKFVNSPSVPELAATFTKESDAGKEATKEAEVNHEAEAKDSKPVSAAEVDALTGDMDFEAELAAASASLGNG